MINDLISDYLARIRNALIVQRKSVITKNSKILKKITEILKINGYVQSYEVKQKSNEEILIIYLKYDTLNISIIDGLKRISKPGLRVYVSARDIPSVLGGIGLAVISTSYGIMTCKEAKKKNIGGEILCYIW